MNITTLDPTILVFLDIHAGILIDGEKTLFCPLLAHTHTHTHTQGSLLFPKTEFFTKADMTHNQKWCSFQINIGCGNVCSLISAHHLFS